MKNKWLLSLAIGFAAGGIVGYSIPAMPQANSEVVEEVEEAEESQIFWDYWDYWESEGWKSYPCAGISMNMADYAMIHTWTVQNGLSPAQDLNLIAGISNLPKCVNEVTVVEEDIPVVAESNPKAAIEEEPESEEDEDPVSEPEGSGNDIWISESDANLIALVTMGEAESECEEDKRMVIDTILNRVDSEHFPDTIYNVVYQKGAFSCMWDGRIDRCYVQDDILQLVYEEAENRTNSSVIFFMLDCYSKYGTPMFNIGRIYFSSF